jgi:hypothetical protein
MRQGEWKKIVFSTEWIVFQADSFQRLKSPQIKYVREIVQLISADGKYFQIGQMIHVFQLTDLITVQREIF